MCGIAGIVSNQTAIPSLALKAEAMQRLLAQRGPDDRDCYTSPDETVALLHTRLSILDLSAAGRQPMVSSCGRYRIVFNGEIYNFRALRKDLEASGESFHTKTDTEVILSLYRREGGECVNKLRGMFAFAIWDDKEKKLFLARDPFGIKPLYYHEKAGTLVFASEIRALLASGIPERRLSVTGTYGYLLAGSVQEPWTLVNYVYSLPAGTCATWKNGKLETREYWQMEFKSAILSWEEAIESTRCALIDSIEHHFVSDVPVGVFLSGGIDSTAVLALARETQSNELRTYSIAFEEEEKNEGPIAKRTANHFATDHVEHVMTADEGRKIFEHFRLKVDLPTVDGFNTYCISRVAREHGTKVCLSGLGGDEFFNGYPSFSKVPRLMRWRRRTDFLNGIMSAAGRTLESVSSSPKQRRMGHYLQSKNTPSSAARLVRSIFSAREAAALAKQLSGEVYQGAIDPVAADGRHFEELLDEISYLEVTRYMRNQLLRDSDVLSMAVGLELRVPLVDSVLFESIASIPTVIRLAAGKQLLVQSVPEIPEWVINRPKSGFAFPFQQWIEGSWDGMIDPGANVSGIPMDTWYRRWSVSLLEWWISNNIEQAPKAA